MSSTEWEDDPRTGERPPVEEWPEEAAREPSDERPQDGDPYASSPYDADDAGSPGDARGERGDGVAPVARPPRRRGTARIAIILGLIVLLASLWGLFLRPGAPGIGWLPTVGEQTTIDRSEWAFEMVQATDLAAAGRTGSGIAVCIVDTGIDVQHPDLKRTNLVLWKDFVNNRPDAYDDDGHGTGMAGLIVANGAIDGAAPDVSLMMAKAIAKGGTGSSSAVANAINWCTDPNGDGNPGDGAAIISLSLGGANKKVFGTDVDDAANAAIGKGIFVVAAAGNDGENDNGDVEAPASQELVIAVGAVDRNRVIASFSSRGDNDGKFPFAFDDRKDPNKKPEVVAPGVKVITTWIDDPSTSDREEYAEVSGTSPATALTSGVLALVLQEHPEYVKTGSSSRVKDLKNGLMSTCEKAPGQQSPHDDRYGYGILKGAALSSKL